MSKKAFDKIAEGLNEALSIARGASKPAKLHIPPEIVNPIPDMMIYPIEIRPGVVAQVRVPVDLTKPEAEKIARVVLALGGTPP